MGKYDECPEGNAISEPVFGTMLGSARSLTLSVPHLLALVPRCGREDGDGGPTCWTAACTVWSNKPLGKMEHLHERACVFNRLEEYQRSGQLTPRAIEMYRGIRY